MRIAITGSTGLVGTALVEFMSRMGHTMTRVVRTPHRPRGSHHTVIWHPETGDLDAAELEGHDVVIHLAGETFRPADGRGSARHGFMRAGCVGHRCSVKHSPV